MYPTSVVALYCEDIREEIAGGVTLVGVYPDNLNVPSVPGALPKLSIYARVHFDATRKVRKVVAKLTDPSGAVLKLAEVEKATIKHGIQQAKDQGQPMVGLVIRADLVPFPVSAFGRSFVEVEVDGLVYRAGSLRFQRDPNITPASVPPPPS